jgi:sterol desaturase/sphingolipid hydroxylase (fatty acid hydroxylase superfamily)
MDLAQGLKPGISVVLLVVFWIWETLWPFFGVGAGRWLHAARNLAIALLNTTVLALVFSTVTVSTANWSERHGYGLLNRVFPDGLLEFAAGILLLDAWLYLWHRANHRIPFLWRFHRMHHSDNRMDVTTATRFHLGEHVLSATLRLGLIPLLGLRLEHILIHDVLVIAVTQLHHADISLGRLDRWLSWWIVTPFLHKVHHSRWRPETDSNYSTVFSVWDRLACTLRTRSDPRTIEFGLDEFDAPRWQTLRGMLSTPLRAKEPAQSSNGTQNDQNPRRGSE